MILVPGGQVIATFFRAFGARIFAAEHIWQVPSVFVLR
jgi:hypothetical protein